MLKRKYFFTYYHFPIPSLFVVEGVRMSRFKTKKEILHDIQFFYKKIFTIFKKRNNRYLDFRGITTKSLSSFDYEIQKKGGIVDNMGNVHTTAQSYKNYLKENNLVIKDWSDGSNTKPKQQLSNRADIARAVNKYL